MSKEEFMLFANCPVLATGRDPIKSAHLVPYGWGIVDNKGKSYFAHDCIAQHPEDLRQTIEYLNEPEGDEDHRAP
jgi:hypothetical protein